MKQKNFRFLVLAMLVCIGIGTWAIKAKSSGKVAKIGSTEYATFADALSAVQDGDVIYLLADADASSVAFTPCNGKKIIIAGSTGNETLDMGNGAKGGISGTTEITFLNLKMQIRHTNTSGIWYTENIYHAGKVKYENVVFDGAIATADYVEFLNCTFASNPQSMEYTVWNYGGTQVFKGCTFEAASAGTKSFIKDYAEPAGTLATNLVMAGCTFNVPNPTPSGWKGSTIYFSTANSSTSKIYLDEETTQAGGTVNYSSGCESKAEVCSTLAETGFTLPTPTKLAASVAKIGDVEYASLAEAVAAVPTNDTETTITMIDNEAIEGNAGVTIAAGQNIVLDLNGKTVKNLVNEDKGSQVIANKGTLTIKDSSDPSTGLLTNAVAEGTNAGEWWGTTQYNYATNVITNTGTLIVESGEIYETAASSICYAIDNNSSAADAILTVNGGYIHKDSGTAIRMFCNSTTKENTVIVNGGTIEAGYAGIWTQLPGNSGQAKKGEFHMTGGTIKGEYAWYDYSYGDVFDAMDYAITGGTIDGYLYSYGVESFVSGGTFTEDPSDWCADGFTVKENTDGSFGVAKAAIAKIGDVEYASLAEAVAAVPTNDTETTITMIDNEAIEGNAGVTIAAGQNIVLDLNGKTVSQLAPDAKASQLISNKGTLTIKDSSTEGAGTLTAKIAQADPNYGYGNYTILNNGKLTIESGNIFVERTTGIGGAVYCLDAGAGSDVNITGGYIEGKTSCTAIRQTSFGTAQNDVCISGGTIKSGASYTIQVRQMSATQNSTFTISGDAHIINTDETYNLAVYTTVYQGSFENVYLNITGGTFDGDVAAAESMPANRVSVSGGTFNGYYGAYSYGEVAFISGGTFTGEGCEYSGEFVAQGFELKENADGTFGVAKAPVAKIGDVEYASLSEAVAAVPTDGTETTITMLADETIEGNTGVTIAATQNVVLDLNSKTVTILVTESKASQIITNKGTLKIIGEGTMTNALKDNVKPGDWPTYNYATNLITNLGTLTIENGTFNNTQDSGITYTLDNNSNGVPATATINGGTFKSAGNAAVRMFCNSTTAANTLTINGGYFEGTYYAVSVSNASGATKVGSLTINGGEFESTADEYNACIANWESNKSSNIAVNITGGKFNDYVLIASNANVTGGTYKYDKYTDPDDGTVYDLNSYCAEGFELLENEDGTFGVEKKLVLAPTTIEYYAGNSTKVEGTVEEWEAAVTANPNTIAFVSSEYADFAEANTNVVVDYAVGKGHYYECPNFVLTDLVDFYTPVDFEAVAGSYTRSTVLTMNSVCMPFAIDKTMLSATKIGTFVSANLTGEGKERKGTLSFKDNTSVEAGTPCIVECSESVTSWKVEFNNTHIVAQPNNANALQGTFVKKTIGVNYFKVASDGKSFVNSNEESANFQFRACVDLTSDSELGFAAKSLNFVWDDENEDEATTTGINNVNVENAANAAYDLSGRKAEKLVKGNMYIINGKKTIIK